jgi:hypothetical protein
MRQTHRRYSDSIVIPPRTRLPLGYAALAAFALSAVVVATAFGNDTPLGAPRFWPWLLTGLQVVALWSAGTGKWWGWLLGGSVQLPWIAYAIVTMQLGFIPGCTASATVQLLSFIRSEQGLSASRRTALRTGVRHPKGDQR